MGAGGCIYQASEEKSSTGGPCSIGPAGRRRWSASSSLGTRASGPQHFLIADRRSAYPGYCCLPVLTRGIFPRRSRTSAEE